MIRFNQMDNKEPDFFNSSLGLRLTAPEVVREVIAYMGADLTRKYKVTIGTDSELLSTKQADFVTAIVVHRIGNGGRYFWRRFELGKFHTLRDRMIRRYWFRSRSRPKF